MSWVQFPPPALLLILILATASPLLLDDAAAEASIRQENTPTTVLFNVSGNSDLSTSAQPTAGSNSGTLAGPISGALTSTFTSMPLYSQLLATDDGWGASMYLSGTGNVWVRMILSTNSGEIGRTDSGPIGLNGNPQEVMLTSGGLTSLDYPEGTTFSITYEVRANSPASVTMRWGEETTPSQVGIQGDFISSIDMQVSDPGNPFDDGDGDYGRENVQVSAFVSTRLDLDAMMQRSILFYSDGEDQRQLNSTEISGDSGEYTLIWMLPDLGNGSNISTAMGWEDDEGIIRINTTSWEWVFPQAEEESLLDDDTLRILQLSTFPLLFVMGFWLVKRNQRFCSQDEKISELDYRAFNTLVVSACCYFIAALNIMFFIVNHHIRNLGAAESQIILHLGVLALIYGASGPIWGRIADANGNRRGLVKMAGIIGALTSLVMAPLGLWPFFTVSMILMACLGVQRLHFACASEWFPEQKGEAIGILYAFGYLVTAVFAVVSGSIYNWLGIWATCVTSALLVAIGTISFLRIDTDRTEPRVFERRILDEKQPLLSFESKWVKWCLLGAMLVAIPRGAVVLTSPRYIEIRGFDIAMTSLFESWAILALVLLYVIVGRICDRHGAERVLLASALGYGILWSLFSLGLSPWMSVAIYVIPIVPLLLVSNDSLLSHFTSTEERNRGIGMAGAAAYVGQAIGIALIVGLMAWFESAGNSNLDVYHYAYRSNIPLFALAVVVTAWLSMRIRAENATNN